MVENVCIFYVHKRRQLRSTVGNIHVGIECKLHLKSCIEFVLGTYG